MALAVGGVTKLKSVLSFGLIVSLVLAGLFSANLVVAQEQEEVVVSGEKGDYGLAVGFQYEPIYEAARNAVELTVTPPGTNGISADLMVEVVYLLTGEAIVLDFVPSESDSNVFLGRFTPSAPGDYSVRIIGMLDDVTVDELFAENFSAIVSPTEVEEIIFPAQPRANELNELINANEAAIGELADDYDGLRIGIWAIAAAFVVIIFTLLVVLLSVRRLTNKL